MKTIIRIDENKGLPEIDEIPDTKPEIDVVTGGETSDGVREQIESEYSIIETPETADNPDTNSMYHTCDNFSDRAMSWGKRKRQ